MLRPSLRILHICGTFAPEYGGGATETTKDIALLQVESGHSVTVLCATYVEGEAFGVFREVVGGLDVVRVVAPSRLRNDPEGFGLSLREQRHHASRIRTLMEALIDEIRPDVVDYHVNRLLGEEAILTSARRGVPVVASLHDFWLICPRVTFMRSPTNQPCSGPGPFKCLLCLYSHQDGSIARAVPKLAWRVPRIGIGLAWKIRNRRLALREVRAGMGRSGAVSDAHAPFINGPCAPILHGISAAPTAPLKRVAGPRLRFGFFGGAAREKGLASLLQVFRRMTADGLEVELHVFGPGEVEPEPNVFVHGRFTAEGRAAAYAGIDVALMATEMVEPRGRIPEEAALVGVPSVVPRIGGLVDVVRDEVDGLLYRFRDPLDLERQLRRLVLEPGLLARLRTNLRPPARLSDALPMIESMYRDAIRRSRTTGQA